MGKVSFEMGFEARGVDCITPGDGCSKTMFQKNCSGNNDLQNKEGNQLNQLHYFESDLYI